MNTNPKAADIYRAPGGAQLAFLPAGEADTAPPSRRYPIVNGIPDFLGGGDVGELNAKYMRFYDRISNLYHLGAIAAMPFNAKWTEALLGDLAIRPGDRVLEVSVGSGANIPYLYKRQPDADYWGMDISWGMLRQCRKQLRAKRIPIELCRANAEVLPYGDNCFDVVFHIGGINYFDNKAAALREMVRVAKPGTRILVIDETDKWVRGVYQRMPVVSNYYRDMDDPARTGAPVDHLPAGVEDVTLELVWKGGMYKLSFTKPVTTIK